MPKLKEINRGFYDWYKFKEVDWWNEATNQKGLAKGGIYLLSGPEGVGKTTLALEMGVDLASLGKKVLYLTLEQTPDQLKEIIEDRIFPFRESKRADSFKYQSQKFQNFRELEKLKKIYDEKERQEIEKEAIIENFNVDSEVKNAEELPDFLSTEVLYSHAKYLHSQVIFVDSIQGLGITSSIKSYKKVIEFNQMCKEKGITAILTSHVTKAGDIAGPRSLQHNVDCIIYIRKAFKIRPLFVPKNRFGPERYEPFGLLINKYGCFEKSKHMEASVGKAHGFNPYNLEFIELQTLVKLPKFGEKPGIIAPYLPQKKSETDNYHH